MGQSCSGQLACWASRLGQPMASPLASRLANWAAGCLLSRLAGQLPKGNDVLIMPTTYYANYSASQLLVTTTTWNGNHSSILYVSHSIQIVGLFKFNLRELPAPSVILGMRA